jgi:TPR repeat protein
MKPCLRNLALLALALMALPAGAAVAGPMDDARAAFNHGDAGRGLAIVRPLAEAGDPEAQAQLGLAYSLGMGLKPDSGRARFWLHRAAGQGYGPAREWMLVRCSTARRTPLKDCLNGLDGLDALAAKGDAKAELTIGRVWLLGLDVQERNVDKGLAAIRKAADQGLAEAQLQMGLIYGSGLLGVPADPAQAIAWHRKAAEQGSVAAMDALAQLYDIGPASLRDPAQAAQWYGKAADKGSVSAQARLAADYALGHGVARDLVQAWAWFDVALAREPSGDLFDINRLAQGAVAAHLEPEQLAEAKRRSAEIKARMDKL